MRTRILLHASLAVVAATVAHAAPTQQWMALPQPSSITFAQGSFKPSSSSAICLDPGDSAEMHSTAEVVGEQIGKATGGGGPSMGCDTTSDRITVHRKTAVPAQGFEIDVSSSAVDISVSDADGLFYAGQQIVQNVVAQGVVPSGHFAGSPAVAERGLHVDNGRKQYTKAFFEGAIRDMSYVGLNALQLHFCENLGFGIESKTHPGLASPGALSQSDVRDLIEYAKRHHVQIVPSMDVPGHSATILKLFPELGLKDSSGASVEGAFDIANPRSLAVIQSLVDEFAALFKGASTKWNIGADEFVDFENPEKYPSLQAAAVEQFGTGATLFDLLTGFANTLRSQLASHGYTSRVWNDGMFRSTHVKLQQDIDVTWWTNYSPQMAHLDTAREAGNHLVNFNDALLYYVLGENAGYTYPTAQRFWDKDWRPGVFPTYSQNDVTHDQFIPAPYPSQLLGAYFSIWSDKPQALTEAQVADGIRAPMRAMAERVWNDGSKLSIEEFGAFQDSIKVSPQ